MKCENMIGKNFDNLTQRIVYAYKITYPDFIAIDNENATKESQENMHAFLSDVICYIYDNPSFIQSQILPDEYYENGVLNNTNPKLILSMKSIDKKILTFFEFLLDLGKQALLLDDKFHINKDALKISNDKIKKLELLGIKSQSNKESYTFYSEKYNCFPAWKILSDICLSQTNSQLSLFMFMHCIYDVKHISATHIYGDLSENNEYLKELQDFLCEKGYTYSFIDNRLRLEKNYPEKQHGGMLLQFEWRRKYQMNYEFQIPSFRTLLSHYDKMDDELIEMIITRTKNCDNCGYCTQTDKTGKRKPLCLVIENNSEKFLKCPLYPNFKWLELTSETAMMIKKLFVIAEESL